MNIPGTNIGDFLDDNPLARGEYLPPSEGIEKFLASIGLRDPSTRFVVYGTAVAVALFALEPEFAFYKHKARPWSVLTGPDDETEVPCTKCPWYVLVGGAALFGLAF